jgi:hypothetical protein
VGHGRDESLVAAIAMDSPVTRRAAFPGRRFDDRQCEFAVKWHLNGKIITIFFLFCFGSSLSGAGAEFRLRRPPTNLRNGFSSRKDDESGALGAQLLREGGRRQETTRGTADLRRSDEGDQGTP